MRETTLQTPRSVKEGRRCFTQQGRDFPAAHGEHHGCPLQPVDDPTLEQADMPRRMLKPVQSPHRSRLLAGGCSPWREAHAGVGLLAGPVVHGDPHWRSVLLKDCIPWKGPMLERFLKNHSPWEGPTLEKLYPMGGTPQWST